MSSRSRPVAFRPSLPFVLLAGLLCVLWLAGGSSRSDTLGQTAVRATAWATLIAAVLLGGRPSLREIRPVGLLLMGALLLVTLQLVPLPPAMWQALPGRAVLNEAAAASGQPPPWRPWSIVPDATLNAWFSFVVPIAVLLMLAGLREDERARLPAFLLGLVTAAMLLGLLQFSGVWIDNPFINDEPNEVAGIFANRNHFAVFLAMGCLLAPVWAFLDGRRPQWRGPVALGLVILFVLTILASGSRAGMLVGAMALTLGLVIVRDALRRTLKRYPRYVSFALPAAIVVVIVAFIGISVAAGRAVSVDRIFASDQIQDMRIRSLPVIVDLVREYLPLGAGLGGFDALFRMNEPFALLEPTYLNHAHNDFLEVALDAGVPGLALLAGALVWWGRASVRAWRTGSAPGHTLPKLGSAMLLLVVVASAFDYPARTPMMMAMMVIAGAWLCRRPAQRSGALPTLDHQL